MYSSCFLRCNCLYVTNAGTIDEFFYYLWCPVSGKYSDGREKIWIPIIPPYEQMDVDFDERDAWSEEDKTANFITHPVRTWAGEDEKVLPYSLYIDATPFSNPESFYGVALRDS